MTESTLTKPILLFNDECAVCRVIARWVCNSAEGQEGGSSIDIRPIGNDPDALRILNPALDIWDAYANIHILMPDGTMRTDGEAVAETLRNLPNTRWLARCFNVKLFGRRPFQAILNGAYTLLADLRPLLGCESCGIPPPWLRPFHWLAQRITGRFRGRNHTAIKSRLTKPPTLKRTR
ncbi:Protein of unknown function, DUF393 [Granulicella rosea]|uniref:DUF393 domain-containing protein n=1 Tax=Granulicella rosea TaxID=474952 RepID=A0A239GQC0_9BACT|nr:Protein of unknown function, DUF393 [Granulicella rosea]